MACPPFVWIVDVSFGVVFLLWIVAWNKSATGRLWATARTASSIALFILLLILPGVELFHRRTPVIEGTDDHLVVIGDSISSGLGVHTPPWPAIMQQMTGVVVRNLSRPGATTMDGVTIAVGVTDQDHLVLVELGGNDLIAGEASDTFERSLEAVLAKLTAPGRKVVMFELPLLPNRIAYGRIQRKLAARYGVSLIPKRFLAEIIAGQDATSDGLHLTEIGARRMAVVVKRILLPALRMRTR